MVILNLFFFQINQSSIHSFDFSFFKKDSFFLKTKMFARIFFFFFFWSLFLEKKLFREIKMIDYYLIWYSWFLWSFFLIGFARFPSEKPQTCNVKFCFFKNCFFCFFRFFWTFEFQWNWLHSFLFLNLNYISSMDPFQTLFFAFDFYVFDFSKICFFFFSLKKSGKLDTKGIEKGVSLKKTEVKEKNNLPSKAGKDSLHKKQTKKKLFFFFFVFLLARFFHNEDFFFENNFCYIHVSLKIIVWIFWIPSNSFFFYFKNYLFSSFKNYPLT